MPGKRLEPKRIQCERPVIDAPNARVMASGFHPETANTPKIRPIEIRKPCRRYDTDEPTAAGLVGLAQQASVTSRWHRHGDLGLEAAARRLTTYSPDIVLSLLQTPAYARVLTAKVLSCTLIPTNPDSQMAQVRMSPGVCWAHIFQ